VTRARPLLRRANPVVRSPCVETRSVDIHMDPGYRDGANALTCPRCRYPYLHHGRVVIYDRGQDDEQVTKTTVNGSVAVKRVRARGSGNPSSRRHGLAIRFQCEGCDETSELTVEQHKGMTFFAWRRP
jgi:hypothetical protein